MTSSKSNRINPEPCGPDQEQEQWQVVREQFEQVFPKIGCATENWRMTNGLYPSHPEYPSCPSFQQMCTVQVSHGGETVRVYLPCPRNRDPNIEAGDSVMYQQDGAKNPIYMGGHDEPIGTVRWWHGKPSEVPRGWYWINNAAPPQYNTRTGRFAVGHEKYVKNYFDIPAGTDPELGTLGMHCDGQDASVDIEDHEFTPSISILDHTHGVHLAYTGLEVTLYCGEQYVGEACPNLYGSVNIANHDHQVSPAFTTVGVNAPGGTPMTLAAYTPVCSSTARTPPCGSALPAQQVQIYGGCHTHHFYDGDCYIDVFDPGHSHGLTISPHEVTVSGVILGHEVNMNQMTLPRVYFLLLERLNNSANVVGVPIAAGQFCTSEP